MGIEKSPLSVLRKKTGFSLSLCKKALTQNENDIARSMEWLEKQAQIEGWEKASKLSGRDAAQGLIGILVKGSQASMVELRCETDFVARNSEFRNLLNEFAAATLKQSSCSSVSDSLVVHSLARKELNDLSSVTYPDKTLADVAALSIAKIGENVVLKRGVTYSAPEGINLATVTHPILESNVPNLCYGRYGTILAYTHDSNNINISNEKPSSLRARELCQHIIGMNPTEVGNLDDENPESQSHLVHQDFLLDDEYKVGQLLSEIGFTVHSFQRYEVGK